MAGDALSNVAVIGPGAIGATVAGCLAEAGHDVILCGRTPHDRIVVEPDEGEAMTVEGPVLTDPAAVEGPADAVFVAVKATQIAAAAPWLEALTSESTPVCVLQNGVEQVELVAPHTASAHVIASVVWFPAEVTEPGRVHLRGVPQITVPDGHEGRAVAALLDGSRCEVTLAGDFTTATWHKLLVNATAALMVLASRRAVIFRRDDVAGLARDYLAECAAVARAEGAQIDDDAVSEMVGHFAEMPPDLGSSILFDHEAGRPLEWDARNAVITRRARTHGIATPIGDVVVPLLAAASDG